MKLNCHARWLLLPLALLVGFVPLVLRERHQSLQSQMPGLWRFEKAGTTVQIAPSDGDNLLTVISKDEHGSYLSLFEIVDAGHVRIIRSTSTGNLARVKIAPSGRSMIIDQGNYPGEGTAKYIRIK